MSDWEDQAACVGAPASWWFPCDDTPGDGGRQAKAICAGCPVAQQCAVGAIERGEEHGIWGGAGGKQMRILRRAHRVGGPVWDAAWSHHLGVLTGVVVEIQDANGPGVQHGIRATAAKGCTCMRCRMGTSLYLRGLDSSYWQAG